MDWLLIGCGALMGWVTLCIWSGERQRRDQIRQAEQREAARVAAALAAEAPRSGHPPSGAPGASDAPPALHRQAA